MIEEKAVDFDGLFFVIVYWMLKLVWLPCQVSRKLSPNTYAACPPGEFLHWGHIPQTLCLPDGVTPPLDRFEIATKGNLPETLDR